MECSFGDLGQNLYAMALKKMDDRLGYEDEMTWDSERLEAARGEELKKFSKTVYKAILAECPSVEASRSFYLQSCGISMSDCEDQVANKMLLSLCCCLFCGFVSTGVPRDGDFSSASTACASRLLAQKSMLISRCKN